MKNFKIAKKLLVSFGIVLILLIIACGVALFGLSSVGSNLTSFYEKPFPVTNRASDMQTAIQSAAKFVGYSTMATDPTETQTYIDNSQTELDKLQDGIDFMKQNFSNPELVAEFETIMNNGNEIKEQVFTYALESKNTEAINVYFNEYRPVLVEALGKLGEINEISTSNADNLYKQANTSKQVVLFLLIAVALIAIVMTITIAVYLTKLLTAPIKELESAAARLAQGDLDVEITYESQDELGMLANSFKKTILTLKSIIKDMDELLTTMASGDFDVTTNAEDSYVGSFRPLLDSLRSISIGLSDTLREISESTSQVSMASSQMADGATSLAEGSTEQASAIEELLATSENIRNDVEDNAQQSSVMASTMIQVGNKAEESSRQMQNLMDAMVKISDSSKEIAAIINTIEEIAEQTNLLSLNAAIEAARAGEAGKGFAVVAGEIGKLASQSAVAVNDTRTLIETALQEVQNGTGISENTAKSMFEVKDEISDAVVMAEKSKESSLAQSAMMSEINAGIEQISGVVQSNSATAEQSSATSEELAAQAETLADLVGKFNLRSI